MATFTEKLELLITATSANAVKELDKTAASAENLGTKHSLLAGATQTAQGALSKFGISAEQTGTALKAAAVGAGALVAVKVGQFALDAANQFGDLTGQVRAFQRVAGTSAEDSSKLVFAVKELGIQPDAAASAFGRLATRLGTGKADLQQYGVEIAHNKDGTVDLAGTVANLSDAFQKTSDPTLRAAIANEAFGRSWQTLSPLLAKGKADLQSIFDFAGTTHQIFSPAQLEAGRQFTVATNQLNAALEGLKIELGSAVAPSLTKFTTGLTSGITSVDSLASHVGGLGNVISTGIDATPIGNFSLAMQGAGDIAKITSGDFNSFSSGVGEAALSVVPFGGAIKDITGIFDSGGSSVQDYTSKQQDLQAAYKQVADLAAQGKTGTSEYKQAVADATAQSADYARVNQDVATSLQSVNEKTLTALQLTLNKAAANLGLQGSELNATQALKDQATAQLDANNAAQFGIDQSDLVAAAHVKAEQSFLAVAKAASDKAAATLAGSDADVIAQGQIDATNSALEVLAQQGGPAAIQIIEDLGFQVRILPDGHVVVTADTSQATAALAALREQVLNFIAFASQAGAITPFGVTPVVRRSPAGPSSAVAPAGGASPLLRTLGAPEDDLMTAGAPLETLGFDVGLGLPSTLSFTPAAAVAQAVTNVTINITAGGLGADAPEIQRAVVDALRGYVGRNGRLENVTR